MLIKRLLADIGHKWLVIGIMATLFLGKCNRSASAATAAEQMSTPFELRPGVVVDPAAARLYLMNPQGGIDAVELATGNLLWTSKAAAKPLAAFDDRLAAQANQTPGSGSLPIVLLDTKSGRAESTISLPTPDRVTPSIDEQLRSSSSVAARVEPDGLLVWWTVTGRSVRPIPGPVSAQTVAGAALINLQSHKVTTVTHDQVDARLRGKLSPAKAPRLKPNESLYYAPQLVDGCFVSVQPDVTGGGQHPVLKRWNAASGEPLPDVELGPGYIASLPSADRSLYLVVSEASGHVYVWSLYAIASGERVAEVRLPVSGRRFFLWHSILIYEVASSGLRALNFKTGAEIWKRALRDTGYHGPYPAQP